MSSSSSSATVDSACGDSNSATMCNESVDAPNAEGLSNDGDEKTAVDRKSDSASDDNYCEEDVDNEQAGDEEEEEQDDEEAEEEDEEEEEEEEEANSSVSTERKPRAGAVRRSSTTSRLRSGRASSANESDSGGEDDSSDMEDDTPRKTIQVGADFQAKIPTLDRAAYPDEKPYATEDKLLWNPNMHSGDIVCEYLRTIKEQRELAAKEKVAALLKDGLSASSWEAIVAATVDSLPHGSHVHDDEQALFVLQQCNFDISAALKKIAPEQQQPVTDRDRSHQWSEEECRNFETGLCIYGKRFNDIQQNKVPGRSVGELVQFYYIWKKTERHDLFGNKARLEKKKYSLHPGTTDYVDRYLDEPDTQAPLDAVHASLALPHSGAAVPPNLAATAAAAIAAGGSSSHCPPAAVAAAARPLLPASAVPGSSSGTAPSAGSAVVPSTGGAAAAGGAGAGTAATI